MQVLINIVPIFRNSAINNFQSAIFFLYLFVFSDGAGRTGTYIAISNLLERMKIEQAVDVFQAIKIIRATRPQFVENAVSVHVKRAVPL